MRKFSILVVLLIFAFGSTVFSQEVKTASVEQPTNVPTFFGYAPKKIVVKFDDSILSRINRATAPLGRLGIPELDNIARRFNVSSIREQFPGATPKVYQGRVIDLAGWHKVHFAEEVDVEWVAAAYKAVSGVIDAQPIGIHAVYGTPNDTRFPDQWHLNQSNDADMDGPEAWDIETGNDQIIAAILDTGVRYFHKDLGGADASLNNPTAADGNMFINSGEVKDDGIDNDNNGFVDDWIGWDFVESESGCWDGEDCSGQDNDPRDFNGHGTHVAGIVAAINNNDYAVSSISGGWGNGTLQPIANGVSIMPLRIGWSSRFIIFEVGLVSMDYAAEAFRYAADNGARLANASWGSSNSGGLGDAIDYFLASGGMIFKASGNDNADDPDYMGNRADIINVAATDVNDCKADFSNFGNWVDISAPGDDILSTYHDHDDAENDAVATLSGTSMASPNALSVAALIWSQDPSMSASEVETRMKDTADDIEGLSCNSSYAGMLGAGRVNAFNGVNDGAGPSPPAAPSNLTATTAGASQIDLAWDDNSSNENGFSIERQSGGGSFAEIATVGADVTSYSDTGLSANTTYTYRVRAFNDAGNSDYSNEASATTDSEPQPPAAPSNLTATTAGASQIDLAWDDNSSNENGFSIERQSGGGSFAEIATVGADVTSYSDTGLSANTTYTYRVRAFNDAGNSDYSNEASATTDSEPQQVMHVQLVEVTKEVLFGVLTRGNARVKIVDANDSPVEGATVTGEWSGGASDSDQFTTNSNGEGTAVSDWVVGDAEFTFCVTDVTKDGWTYDPDANEMTCGSTDGSTSSRVATNFDVAEVELALGHPLVMNHPNPFNPSTQITYYVPKAARVKLDIYNVLGEKVVTLVDRRVSAGVNSVTWNATNASGRAVSSGFYFYHLSIDGSAPITRRMLLMK